MLRKLLLDRSVRLRDTNVDWPAIRANSLIFIFELKIMYNQTGGNNMIQIPNVTINGKPFVVNEQFAITQDGRVIPVEDRPADTRWGR